MSTLQNAISSFLENLEFVKNASPHTLRNYSMDLRGFTLSIQKSLEKDEVLLEEIKRRQIREFLAGQHEKLKKKSIVRHLSSLRSFFRFAITKKWIKESPLEEIETPKSEKKLPIFLTYQQVEILFEQPDISDYLGLRDRTMMELFYSSGLRVSELALINREDVNFSEHLLKVKGKGRKERIVPITKTAASWMKRYLLSPDRMIDQGKRKRECDHEAFFLNRLGTRMTTRSIDRNFALHLKRSGISSKATPHTIRHTIATHWLEKGMDLKTIQMLLGHKCLATTTIYTQVSQSLKKRVYEKTHPRANFPEEITLTS